MILQVSRAFLKDQFRTAHSSNSTASAEFGGGASSGGPKGTAPSGGGEAECLFVFACPKEAENLPHY